MATVKLKTAQNGALAVVLKDGKVSCSCCGVSPECCMYPAPALNDGLITASDLPNSIEVVYQGATYTYLKNGQIFEFGNQSLRPIDGRWAFFLNGVEQGSRQQQCLIAPDESLKVFDVFKDAYSVVAYLPGGGIDWQAIVERESLCFWVGTSDSVQVASLSYNDGSNLGPSFSDPHKWLAGDQAEWFGIKSGLSNTPVGTYPDAAPLFPGGYIEVTEV